MSWIKTNKYGNKKVTIDGHKFDSKLEAQRYMELKLLEHNGLIKNLKLQQEFELIPTQRERSTEVYKSGPNKGLPKLGKVLELSCKYVADFTYTNASTGQFIVEDAKGRRTPEYIIKRKLMLWVHDIRIKEITRKCLR